MTERSATERVGSAAESSLTMVQVAWARAMVAPMGLDRVKVKVSLGSTVVSPVTTMGMVLEVCPGSEGQGAVLAGEVAAGDGGAVGGGPDRR